MHPVRLILFLLLVVTAAGLGAAPAFHVATFNLENYLDVAEGSRPVKSPAARAKVRESILSMRPDVLALEEVGSLSALEELRSSLKAEGLAYPYVEQASGYDTNIFVAILSRFPIVARHSHTNDTFLLDGRRFRISRGFAVAEIEAAPSWRFIFVAAHLKSRRASAVADEGDLRYEEARLLRALIDHELERNPNANLVVAGDFNDVKNSRALRVVTGKGFSSLIDTRPAERNGDDARSDEPHIAPRTITWTHYFGKEDTYSRIDYILMSHGMSHHWLASETYIPRIADWGLASDHRPICAGFTPEVR
jgi:endonuclease/exonuclease/phosphatase family metal-dependent hydrolase